MLTASELGMAEENGELLLMAAMYDQVDFLDELLNAGVHGTVYTRDRFGMTPLHHAAHYGSHRCVEILLQKEADPDACSHTEDNCNTPLHHAAIIRSRGCMQLLVEYGANIELRNVEGKTAMDILKAQENARECIAYLKSVIERKRIEQEEANREDLYCFVTEGLLEEAKKMLDSLENVQDAINRYYRGPNTLLYKASFEGHAEIVRLLLEYGANGRPNGAMGMTPLYAACYAGKLEVAKILIEKLPNSLMQPTTTDHSVPLHAAISRKNIEVIRYLLSLRKECDSDEKVQARDTSILDVNCMNNAGMSPLHLAVSSNNKEVVLELLNCKPILKGQVESPHPSQLAIDIAGKAGQTPLHIAIREENVEIARMLLLNGADPNRSHPDPGILNPLQEACRSNCRDVVKLLLDHGANPNIFHPAENADMSPLCIAAMQDSLLIVKLLMEYGAKDASDAACLQAIKNDSDPTVAVLLEAGVYTETESDLQAKEANLTAARIIWSKRQLPIVKEKWIIESVIRLNANISLQKNVRLNGILDETRAGALITKLDLSSNNLKAVPLLLFQLPSLRQLTLADNHISCLPTVHVAEKSHSEETVKEGNSPYQVSGIRQGGRERTEELSVGGKISNGDVKIRPVSASFVSSKPVLEQYQQSARQESRPFSVCVPKSWECQTAEHQATDKIDGPMQEAAEDGQNDCSEKLAWNCPLLEELDLRRNELTSVPKCLFELQSLKILNLASNRINELPLEMWSAPGLKDVLLQENELECLPSHRHLTRKQQQIIRQISKADGDEPDSKQRAAANVSSSNTVRSRRPSWDGESSDESDEEDDLRFKSGLYKLDISGNKGITSLPMHLPCLAPNLCKLTAAECSIQGPICLSQLPPELTMLDLSGNQIQKFDATSNEPAVDRSCFSPTLAKLNRRSSPYFGAKLPKQMKKFCNHRSHLHFLRLKTINFADNKLGVFLFVRQHSSSDLFDCALPELQTLTLTNNELNAVPVHIGKLRNLCSLDINGNPNIEVLPPELGLCSKLYELKFNPLQIREPNRAVVEKRNQKGIIDVPYIRNFLKGVCERATPYPTIKLMLVGHSGKGKSTLLDNLRREGTGAYQHHAYPQRFPDRMRNEPGSPRRPNEGESTVGVDVSDWTYQRKHFIGSNVGPEVKFSTWDFAGQEEYYATHTCFLSRRAIYLLVWKLTDGVKGIDQLEGWLLNIQARAPDSSVIIVGTHYDQVPAARRRQSIELYRSIINARFVSKKVGGRLQDVVAYGLPQVIAVTEVSSKPRAEFNIRELRTLIYEKVLSLRDSGDGFLLETPVPASYLELEKVVTAKANILRQEEKYPVLDGKQFKLEMQQKIRENGCRELKDDELENAVKFLHDCGVLLHFDCPSLEDLYFIDPQWLCDMLANVITIRDVNPFIKNGVLKVEDLRSQIFRGRRFSSSHVKKYIDLMNKFEVALQISSHYLLVPSLLPEKQASSMKVSNSPPTELQDCMGDETYFKANVFRRLYRLAYIPSGFWARLITRLFADSRIGKTVKSCSSFVNSENETPERIKILKEALGRAAPPEWACWKTGVELSCFGVKLFRVCELSPGKLFYGHSGDRDDHIDLSDSTRYFPDSRRRFIEIIVPNVHLQVEVDCNEASNEKTGFRVLGVDHDKSQRACEMLALAAEHFDNLITDWFPQLTKQSFHGDRPVRKIGLCPACLKEKIESQEATNKAKEQAAIKETVKETESSVTKQPKKARSEGRLDHRSRTSKGGAAKATHRIGGKASRKTIASGGGRHPVDGNKARKSANSAADASGKEEGREEATDASGVNGSPQGADVEERNRDEERANDKSEHANGDEAKRFQVNNRLMGFEFEEAMKKMDVDESIQCLQHGIVEYSKIFPDLVFADLPDSFVYQPEEIETKKFIAAGSYGAVFRATLLRNNQRIDAAVKVPNNTDAGSTLNLKARQDAEKNKKLKEGALTIFTTSIYTAIRQELAILVPVSHPHVIDLIGLGLSPLRLLVEFAPKGSLDSILSDYRKAGRKLDQYTLQDSIVQVAGAIEYLHEQAVIYRDLKSENILVWSFPEPGESSVVPVKLKVTDYGVSQAVAIGGVKGHWGTPGFMAPEILRYHGKESYSKKVDSFSFGSFIFELLTLELPFQKYGSGQADQFMANRKRPKLVSGDRRVPIPVLSLLYKCWEHDPLYRPSSAEIHAYAKLPEFPRLFDDLDCDDSFRLKCALTAYKERPHSATNCADTKSIIGSVLWLFSNGNASRSGKSGEVTVVNYLDGKCSVLKVFNLPDKVIVACVVGSTIWIGMESGAVKVYCSMTYKPLGLGRAHSSGSIISILHSPVCHCVIVGLTNDCLLSYNENISAFVHTIPQDEAMKNFGNIKYSIKELIASKVYPGNSIYSPIHCMAAVPSRQQSEPIEDTITYYGPDGEPLASSSRTHRSSFDECMKGSQRLSNVVTYELWCGVDKGLINIFDLKELEKVHVVSAPGCDSDDPAVRNLSVKCVETRRTFETGAANGVPKQDGNEATSVWVAVYPGTSVYRWNVDQRKMEAKVDALACSISHELNSIKPCHKSLEVREAQVNVILVVENELYIGTSSGYMVICDSMSLNPLMNLRCFSEQIDCLVPLQMTLNCRGSSRRYKEQLVLCSGRGCLDMWNKGRRKRSDDKRNSTILTWFADRWSF